MSVCPSVCLFVPFSFFTGFVCLFFSIFSQFLLYLFPHFYLYCFFFCFFVFCFCFCFCFCFVFLFFFFNFLGKLLYFWTLGHHNLLSFVYLIFSSRLWVGYAFKTKFSLRLIGSSMRFVQLLT